MKLYELPKMSKLKVETLDGMKDAIFDHLDGAYSLCYFESSPEIIFHLGAATELEEVNGRYQIISTK